MAPTPTSSSQPAGPDDAPEDRAALRRRLQAERLAWSATDAAQVAQLALTERLKSALRELEPLVLGVYWPLKGEFNPCPVALWAQQTLGCRLALPRARKSPPTMVYTAWQGITPTTYDEWGIPSPDGPEVVPDVLIAPCLGYTARGFRLGYGGGYYDRYLEKHPEICALGAGWDQGLMPPDAWQPAPHDQPFVAVFTPSHTWGE